MRTTNRILSALLGLLLLIVGLAVVFEMALIALGREPTAVGGWYGSLRGVRYADSQFRVTAVVVALIGLILLILELRPRPPQRVNTSDAAGTPLSVPRRSVERRVDGAAATAGVARARSRVRGRPHRWRLRLRGVAAPDQHDSVLVAVQAELKRLDAPDDVPINLALRRPSRSAR